MNTDADGRDGGELLHGDAALVRAASERIVRDFQDGGDATTLVVTDDHERLRAHLTGRIADMLARDPGQLMHVLYRLDVPEARVQDVLRDSWPGDVPGDLADLVIARELAKARTRRLHARGEPWHSGED